MENEEIKKLVDLKYKDKIEGGYKIEEIWNNRDLIKIKSNGVYFVVVKVKDINKDLEENANGATKEIKKRNKTINKLLKGEKLKEFQDKLNYLKEKSKGNDDIILYIGKATRKNGDGLYKRIKEYIQWGYGEGQIHAGGRAIWQIPKCKEILKFYWIRLDSSKESKDMEAELIKKYEKNFGSIPFANIKREPIHSMTDTIEEKNITSIIKIY